VLFVKHSFSRAAVPGGARAETCGFRVQVSSAFIYALSVVFLTTLVLLCFNPGYMNVDTLDMWGQATHQIPYRDWHPVVISILWSQLRHLYAGPQTLLVVEDVLFCAGVILLLRGVAGRWGTVAILAAVVAFPPVFAYLGTIGKDSLLGAALLLAVGLLYLYLENHRPWTLAMALGASFLAFSTRQNAVFGLLPILGLLFWEALRSHKYRVQWSAALLIITISGFAAIDAMVDMEVHAGRGYEYQAIPLYDPAALSARTQRVLFPPEFLSPSGSLAGIDQHLSTRFVNSLIWPWDSANPLRLSDNPHSVHVLTHLWLTKVCAHPVLYVRWRWSVLSALAGLDPIVTTPYLEGISPNPAGITLHSTRYTKAELHFLHSIAQSLFFRAYLYVLLLILLFAWSIWKRRRPMGVAASSGLAFFFAFFVLSVNSEFRFVVYTMFIAVALFARWLAESAQIILTRGRAEMPEPQRLSAREAALASSQRNR